MQRTFNCLDELCMDENSFMDTIKNINWGSRVQRKLKDWTKWKVQKKNKEGTSKPSPKKVCFVNKITRTSRATSDTYNSNFNADTPLWSESSSGEEDYIGMLKGRIRSNVENTSKEVKGGSIEEEEIEYRSVTEKVTLKL